MGEKYCSTMIFERDTTYDCHTKRADPKRQLEQQRCSVSHEHCSIEQQINAGENPVFSMKRIKLSGCGVGGVRTFSLRREGWGKIFFVAKGGRRHLQMWLVRKGSSRKFDQSYV
jgi:hypothetical protein